LFCSLREKKNESSFFFNGKFAHGEVECKYTTLGDHINAINGDGDFRFRDGKKFLTVTVTVKKNFFPVTVV